MGVRVIQDAEDRNRAVRETERSFVVEASAGTGKTRTLVDRVLHLVLCRGPEGPPIGLAGICAITFTEKAAGEMKLRLRQEFEKAAGVEATGERARQALYDLETASISTFHSLAVSLLRERPIEAGLDPRFRALDEIQSTFFFDEVWDEWLRGILVARSGPVEAALRGGFGVGSLKSIASCLRLHAPLVSRLRLIAPVSEDEAARELKMLREQAEALRRLALKSDDKLLAKLKAAIEWLHDPFGCEVPQKPGKCGKGSSWSGDGDTVRRVQELIRTISEFAGVFAGYDAQRLLDTVVRWLIAEFIPVWQQRKQAEGVLDFDDQLEAARTLLMRSRAARREFQERFRTLLVDEFQDTDPTQLDIVLLLAATDLDESDPARLRPAPGRLFIVGDPKQSIYRFRGADVETYLEVAARAEDLGLQRLALRTNFRSVPSILRFVDAAFEVVMEKAGDDGRQGRYLAFGEGYRAAASAQCAVRLIGDREENGTPAGSGPGYIEVESARIAALITQIRGDASWKVDNGAGRLRSARFGDIAILLPALTRADALEEELRRRDIPYVLEGGKFYYVRSEVSSALTLLRAVSNPNDEVALYGALRSIFFGLSDEDLLRARVAGVPFDYRAFPPEGSPLRRPYEMLRGLHEGRLLRPPSETFERVLHGTGAREVLAVRGFQSIANLNKLGRTIRGLQESTTFSEVVETLLKMHEEGAAEAESRVMEETADAVRIMSIHKAKGLDFPIVILAGLGARRRPHAPDFLADPHRRKTFAVRFESMASPEWKLLKEEDDKRETEELIRLLYVALTRARDHLVVSMHHRGGIEAAAGLWSASFGSTRLEPLAEFLSQKACCDGSLAVSLDGGALDAIPVPVQEAQERVPGDWAGAMRREADELALLRTATPQSLPLQAAGGVLGEERSAGFIPEDVRDRAIRLGVAYHEAMEAADFLDPRSAGGCASEAARRHQLDADQAGIVEELVRKTLDSPLLERARRAQRSGGALWRELPYVRRLPGGIEEGKIDLLFQEDGGWVVVDYKTDKITSARSLSERYGPQVREYLEALGSLGLRVAAAYLLLARTGEAVEIPFGS